MQKRSGNGQLLTGFLQGFFFIFQFFLACRFPVQWSPKLSSKRPCQEICVLSSDVEKQALLQVLSGMVAITAPCDVASPAASAVIGLLSGLLVPFPKREGRGDGYFQLVQLGQWA